MQLNILDRAIASVAPGWAAQRARSRVQIALSEQVTQTASESLKAMGAGDSNETVIRSGRWWNPFPRDARADTMSKLPLQRGASRELARTSPIAVGAINTNIDRVVGTGLALVSQPALAVLGWSPERALEWRAKVHQEFSLWADSTDCDLEGSLNFYQLQALVLRSTLESGDCFSNLPDGERTATQPYALRIQVLEADRVGNPLGAMDTPTMAGGIRLNASGAPEAYYIYDQHPGSLAGIKGGAYKGQWVERLGARSRRRRVLHHFRKLRPGSVRGTPYLAPIIDCIKQIARYTEAEIMAAVITAYLTVFIETPTGSPTGVWQGEGASQEAEVSSDPGAEVGLGMGSVVGLAPGEKPHVVNPGRPNPNFEPFILAVIKQMGMALGLPYELLVKQFNASYSASKAALLDAWVYFRSVRYWLSQSFCQPVFETWMAEAVAIGRIEAPGFFADPLIRWAYTRAAWPGASMGSINPKDEVAAYVAAIEARLMTHERAEWELWGSSWEDTYPQKKSEQDRMRADGILPVPKAGAPAPQQKKPPEEPQT